MAASRNAYAVLAVGVAIVATASILIRYAQAAGMPSLTIAAGRLLIAALILTPLVFHRGMRPIYQLSKRHLGLALLSGFCLAVHFATWITSLEYTSVASSVTLVATNPLWVGIASLFILKERLHAALLAGIALTLVGTFLIGVGDTAAGAQTKAPLLGNTLALIGAISASAYLLIGRALRERLPLLHYIWLAYGSAALFLLIAATGTASQWRDWPPIAYFCVLALAIGPQLLGHTAFNWSLRRVPAAFVAVAILGEPIGSALLAWWLFNERVAGMQLIGMAVILIGILIAARGSK